MNLAVTSMLFEDPLMLLLGLIGVAAVLWALSRSRGDTRLMGGAMMALALALAIGVLSWLVETSREKLLARTNEFVKAVEAHDAASLNTMLTPDASVVGPNKRVWLTRAAFDLGLQTFAKVYPDWDHRVIDANARQDRDDLAISRIRVRSKLSDANPTPVPSEWEFIWTREAQGDWQIQEIRPIKIMEQTPTRAMLQR